jgi:hypothetical protein
MQQTSEHPLSREKLHIIRALARAESATSWFTYGHSSPSSFRLLHDRPLSSVARDESRMARDESRMARDESRMTRDESRMAGDYCRPDKSIHRCVRTHSHLYSYIYGLVALLDNIQSSFSKYHYFNIVCYISGGK